jgi:O-antigen/teichoic acid export membrane protein
MARTAGFNIASTLTAGIAGIILARAAGPTVRGEYAAIMAWFGTSLAVGDMGQPAALCFHVAWDPRQAREYVATSRAIMIVTGTLALVAGMLFAPLLAHGNPGVAVGYRIAFAGSIIAYAGTSYIFALQARDLERWNLVRVAQPTLSLILFITLWRLRLLGLHAALLVLAATMLLQTGWAYYCCRQTGLVPGRARIRLVRPLATYGAAQIAAMTPAVLNAKFDQLMLSQTVRAADLGRYAIAASLTLVPIPLVAAIGNVAFPRIAAQRGVNERTIRLQRLAIAGSAAIAAGMLLPLAIVADWLVPEVYGASYRGAVPLVWILAPGAIFLACGQVTGDLLRGRKCPGVVAWAQGLAVVFTVGMIFTLVPLIGVRGAAIASTVAYGVALVAMLFFLNRLSDGTENPVPEMPAETHSSIPER